jgi:hypothetical protein
MHVFFNNINVDQYCAPGIRNPDGTYAVNVTDTSDYTQVQVGGTWGTTLTTDANGTLTGQFNIPDATFKTGVCTLEAADVSNLVLGAAAITSMASAQYTASNLSVTKQTVTLTTVNPLLSSIPVVNTVTSIVTTSNSTVTVAPPSPTKVVSYTPSYTGWPHGGGCGPGSGADPLAQVFTIVTPNQEDGVFGTYVVLYFNQTSLTANNGVSVYLCDVTNGYPDTNSILPFSQVHMPMANVSVSNTGTVGTSFFFESPVFMQNGQQYALVIAPDSDDPDYQVWTANIGDVDVSTGLQMFSQPGVGGTAFYGATATAWTALQTEYVKFKLFVSNFTSTGGDAYFNNANTDYLSIYNVSYPNTASQVLPGDIVFAAGNSTVSTIDSAANAVVFYIDPNNEELHMGSSSGTFFGTSFIQFHRFANSSLASSPNTSTLVATAQVSGLLNPVVDSIVGNFATIAPAGTSVTFEYSGTSNTYELDTGFQPISVGYETNLYDKERIVAGYSNEKQFMAGAKSMTIHARMTTDSQFLSPVIDMVKNKQLVIENLVDPLGFDYNEFFSTGNEKSKYVSVPVTLATGQDSQDIQILLTAYRPPGTDVLVYVKFKNSYDPDPISAKTWTPLINQTPDFYSNPANPSSFNDYTFSTAHNYSSIATTGTITSPNNSVNVSGNGTRFENELAVGWFINMLGNSTFTESARQITSISSNSVLTLNEPFNGNYTNSTYYLVLPPTTAWLSTGSNTLVNGTVTTSTTNNQIVGSSTDFTLNFQPGTIIQIDGDEQAVVSVTDDELLTVGTPWQTSNAGASAYVQTDDGLTYLGSTGSLYQSYIQFKIKVVLQADSSAQVPILKDVRALALQL